MCPPPPTHSHVMVSLKKKKGLEYETKRFLHASRGFGWEEELKSLCSYVPCFTEKTKSPEIHKYGWNGKHERNFCIYCQVQTKGKISFKQGCLELSWKPLKRHTLNTQEKVHCCHSRKDMCSKSLCHSLSDYYALDYFLSFFFIFISHIFCLWL